MRSIIFVEDFYNLYAQNLRASTLSYRIQLSYLKRGLMAAEKNRWWIHPTRSFAYVDHQWENPRINISLSSQFNEIYYKKYKLVMKARMSFLITKLLLQLGSKYDKQNIYWFNKEDYNYPKKKNTTHYLKQSFKLALFYYIDAKKYWKKTLLYSTQIFNDFYLDPNTNKKVYYKNIDLQGDLMDSMEDEIFQIYHQDNKIYKEEILKYFNKQNYPKYNYSKIIQSRIQKIKEKEMKLDKLLK